jgi:Protein of unknown function (DUF1759)
MENLTTKITEMQEMARNLEELRNNLKKLAVPKRTPEALAPIRIKARELWTKFVDINNKLVSEPGLPPGWDAKVKITQDIYEDIKATLEKFGLEKEAPAGGSEQFKKPLKKMDDADDNPFKNLINDTTDSTDKITQLLELLVKRSLEQEAERTSNPTDPASGIRIPEVNFSAFGGEIKDYKVFKSSFMSIVKRSRMTPIEKFHLLRSKLNGEALAEINTLNISDENYEAAWELLDSRYENVRIIVETSLQQLQHHPPTKTKDADSLIKLIQCYKGTIFNISSAEVDPDFKNLLFSSLILQKLDIYTRTRFEDYFTAINASTVNGTHRVPQIEEITRFLEQEYDQCKVVSQKPTTRHQLETAATTEFSFSFS